ncbi:hypothetical protein BJ138DRAFT_1112194 [Hygrophoropsis aurantiaca]|uniref:Uncharacterized protein n=2 Tax=Hygrophoropsis aurantiaca TaxID=72124 RepID=A0ACB8AHC6_9AGAM|nr:hypothetical protein BJ138DRAFT_1017294 [Hygrophoropsis aurantiaca]KAH7912652.1 hypothetical protein BJ138DRAFT_1112194 [Hygrophoropsis aurantiaca]
MSVQHILDSSPVPIPPVRDKPRGLKRSASQASLASLPTPPRTHHKRSRSRARSSASQHASDDSASELDEDLGGGYAARLRQGKSGGESQDDDEDSSRFVRKRRRTSAVLPGHDEEDDENAFWTGRGGTSASVPKAQSASEETQEEDKSPSPALLRYRYKAPVSPPPSRRQSQAQTARDSSKIRTQSPPPAFRLPLPPVTPPKRLFIRPPSPSAAPVTPVKSKPRKIWPVRDSPNNPFLAGEDQGNEAGPSGWESSDDEEIVGEARVREGTPTPKPTHEEKPTITYVFRGQKATFSNPLYDLPEEVIAASKLPMEHPEFEVAEACPPRRLFSAGIKRKSRDRSIDPLILSSLGAKRPRTAENRSDESASETEKSAASTGSRKKLLFADDAERKPVFSKPASGESKSRGSSAEVDKGVVRSEVLQQAREDRERREKASKKRLGPKEGLRAGAVISERDEPERRAMGPVRRT